MVRTYCTVFLLMASSKCMYDVLRQTVQGVMTYGEQLAQGVMAYCEQFVLVLWLVVDSAGSYAYGLMAYGKQCRFYGLWQTLSAGYYG